jgi:predicted lipid-binding transport protein (Tim44 family)
VKKLILAAVIALSAMSVVVTDADARRLGGGGSFGKQSQTFSRPAPTQAPSQATNTARPAAPVTAPTARPPTPWRNILGGAALGLGLGALMSHFGLGGALGGMFSTLLMFAVLAIAVMFIMRMFRRKAETPAFAGSGATGYAAQPQPYARSGMAPEIGSRIEPGMSSIPYTPVGVPADFDVKGFVRHAKTYFIRLQAAWDKADIADIREFTTAEMYAELRLQIQERGASPNTTDVVTLDAELLGIETSSDHYLASVKFSGLIKEAPDVSAEPFTEIWNLLKPVSGGGWVLAGIQQIP